MNKILDGDHDFLDAIRDWLYHFTSDIESPFKEHDSLTKLQMFVADGLKESSISDSLAQFCDSYIATKFKPQLPYLSKYRYMHLWMHWVADNCFTESANASIQGNPLGPKPQDELHTCGDKTLQHTKETHRKRQMEAYEILHKFLHKPADGKETELQNRALSLQIAVDTIELASNEYTLSAEYRCAMAPDSLGNQDFLLVYVKSE